MVARRRARGGPGLRGPDGHRRLGSGGAVERAFRTSLAYHVVGGRRLRLAGSDLSVPAALAQVVAGAPGLSETAATPATAVSPPPGRRDPPECGSYYGQKVDTSRPPFGQGYPHPLPYVTCGYTPPRCARPTQ